MFFWYNEFMTYEELEQKTKSFRMALSQFFKDYVLGWVLLVIAPIIYIATGILGLVWLFVGYTYLAIKYKNFKFIKNIFKDANYIAKQQAVCIDRAGDSLFAPFGNNVLAKQNPMFGVPMQDIKLEDYLKYALHGSPINPTISFIHGLRTIAKTRTVHGHLFTRIVNYFDPNHFIKTVHKYSTNSRIESEILQEKTRRFTR